MTDLESRDLQMDRFLRSSLAAPAPALPPDFDARLVRALHPASQPFDAYRRAFFAGYGIVSAATCAVIMRAQGLGWEAIAVMLLAPLTVVPAVAWARRATGAPIRQHSA